MPRFVAPSDPAPDMSLMSSDGVRFPVHTYRLGTRSAFFRDMTASLPAPETSSAPVKLAEPADVVDILLALLYDEEDPDDLMHVPGEVLVSAYIAADKYELSKSACRILAFIIARVAGRRPPTL